MISRYQWKRESEEDLVASVSSPQDTKKKKKTIFLIAILITLVQGGVLYLFSEGRRVGDAEEKIMVSVAAKTLRQGVILNESMIVLQPIKVGDLKEYLLSESEITSFIGLPLSHSLEKGTPFFKNSFRLKQQKSFLESIPLGKRLFVLNVDLMGTLQNIRVGDRVDVVAHMDIPSFGKATEVILDGARVAGVGDQVQDSQSSRNDGPLSFFVSPEEVKILSFMKNYAVFSIALRNPEDDSRQSGEAVTFNKFIQNKKIRKIIENDSFKILQGGRRNVAGHQ